MVDRISSLLASSNNSMFKMYIEEVIGSLDDICTTYKDKSRSLLEDVQTPYHIWEFSPPAAKLFDPDQVLDKFFL